MLFITAGLLGFNLYGVIHLEQDFDPNWFIPSDSYAADYIEASEKYFPGSGVPVALYVGEKERNVSYCRFHSCSNTQGCHLPTPIFFVKNWKKNPFIRI